ncbi:YiiG family protein [Pendulispora brunnea]|uniref:YiiG family protein n=1 Tax=Pendulispora brunnea TaxID=2905690 RepID=A0ABZ2K515_9BACT
MRNPLLVLTLAVSLIALPGLTGCRRIVRALGKAAAKSAQKDAAAEDDDSVHAASASGANNAEEPEDEDEAVGEKLNAYIDCINSLSDRFHDAERRYFDWANEKTGPTGKERNVYGLYSISDPAKCAAGVQKANGMKPSLPELEQAGSTYAQAVTAAYPVIKEASDYYDQKNYKDDKMAKGKELHPKLVASFDAFDKADKAMRTQVDTLNRQVKERTLAKIEKSEGKKLAYWRATTMLVAEDLVKLGDSHKLDAVDLPKFTAKVDEYEKAVNEFSNYVAAHKDEASKFIMIDSLVGEAKDFLIAAKELMRRVRDKTPYSTGERMRLGGSSEWTVEGSPGKLVKSYNELVNRSNSVRRFGK